jgi:hypothetical protein
MALLFGWNALLGIVLGYPACCTTAFTERWASAVQHARGELADDTVRASSAPPYDWRLNVFARYFGDALIEHFPCSFSCAPSLDLAQRYAAALVRHEPKSYELLHSSLRTPVLSSAQGVASFPNARIEVHASARTLRYDRGDLKISAPSSRLAADLRAASTVRARSDGRVTSIGGRRHSGTLLWFCDSTASNAIG